MPPPERENPGRACFTAAMASAQNSEAGAGSGAGNCAQVRRRRRSVPAWPCRTGRRRSGRPELNEAPVMAARVAGRR